MLGEESVKSLIKPYSLIRMVYPVIGLSRHFIVVEELDDGFYNCFCLDDGLYDSVDVDHILARPDIARLEVLA